MDSNSLNTSISIRIYWTHFTTSVAASSGIVGLHSPNCFLSRIDLYFFTRDSRKSRQKMVKITARFCENRKNHGKITAVHIATNLLKLMVSNSRKICILGKIHTTMTSRSHIQPLSNKTHGLWYSTGKGKVNIFVLNSHN